MYLYSGGDEPIMYVDYNHPFTIDWGRMPLSSDEAKLTVGAFRKVLSFYRSMESVAEQYDSPTSRKALSRVTQSVVLNVWDGYLANRAVRIEENAEAIELAERLGVDWTFMGNAAVALSAVAGFGHRYVENTNRPDDPDLLMSSGKGFGDDASELKRSVLEHSQPLDVHTWSDHPEVNSLVDQIHGAHFGGGNAGIRKKHIKVLLLDLYLRWSIDPLLKTGLSRNVNSYAARSRYNELHVSKLMPEIADGLADAGLIRSSNFVPPSEPKPSRTTRIWPTSRLIQMFEDAKFGPLHIGDHPDREVIVLRDAAPTKGVDSKKSKNPKRPRRHKKQVEVPYEDTGQTKAMRHLVQTYNELLRQSFIDIPTLERGFIELSAGSDGSPRRLHVSQHDKFTRRIFNRGSFDKGGRFWGGWWQRCPKDWREKIFIDDKPVSELDYSGLHIVMLYARRGINYWTDVGSDPYQIDFPDFDGTTEELRAICKQLILVALNAGDETAAFSAFRDEAETGSSEKRMSNETLSVILNLLKDKHQPIAPMLTKDAGIDLMNQDSKIAEQIIDHFTRKSIPILAIHDSFVLPYGYEKELDDEMQKAFFTVMGISGSRVKEVTSRPLRLFRLSPRLPELPTAMPDGIIVLNAPQIPDFFELSEVKLNARINPKRVPRYQAHLQRFRDWLAERKHVVAGNAPTAA